MDDAANPGPLHEIPLDREHDPREEAEAFQRLPEAAKEEIRDAWRRAEGSHVEMRLLRRNSIKAYVVEMTVVFVFFGLFTLLRHPLAVLPVALIGALTGWIAGKLRAGQSIYPWLTGAGYIALTLIGAGGNVFAFVALVSLSALLGFSHQMQRFDRTES